MQTAERLSVTLPADIAALVREKVRSGAYRSNAEVIRAALKLMARQDGQNSDTLPAKAASIPAIPGRTIVVVEPLHPIVRGSTPPTPSTLTKAQQKAAIESFLERAKTSNYRSDGPYGSRDELYDR